MERRRIDFAVERLAAVEGRENRTPDEQLMTWSTVLRELQDDLAHAKANGLTDAKRNKMARKAKKLQQAITDYCAKCGLDGFEYLSGPSETE